GSTVKLFLQQVPLGNLGLLSIINTREGILGRAIKQTLQSVVQFNIPKLQLYEPKCLETINWPTQCPLEYLMLADCSFSQYRSVLSELSNLRMLIVDNIKITDKDIKTQEEFSISQNAAKTQDCQHLTSLSIVKFDGTMEDIELILSLTPSLTRLRLISCRKKFDSAFDGSTWERIIGSKLLLLKNFELFLSHEFWRDTMTMLNISYNNVGDDGARDLANALYNNKTLTNLNLSGNDITNIGVEHLFVALQDNSTLKVLELRSCKTGHKGAMHLACLLRTNQTLTHLDLKYCDIENQGVKELTDALRTNKSLTTLFLSHNKIDAEGVEYLIEALEDNKTLLQIRDTSASNDNQNLVSVNVAIQMRNNKELNTASFCLKNITSKSREFLINTFQNHETLTRLDLAQDNADDEATLTALYLQKNSLGDEGVKYLADALNNNTTLTELNLEQNSIKHEGAKYLADALKNNKALTALYLANNSLGDEGTKFLADALQNHPTVTSFDMSFQPMQDNDWTYFADFLRTNEIVTELRLNNNDLGSAGAKHLADLLTNNQTLTSLDLSTNYIKDEGAAHLADALQYNKVLKEMDLSENGIKDHGLKSLANSLKINTNTTLISLDFHKNNVGNEGIIAVAHALKTNQKLVELDLDCLNFYEQASQQLFDALALNKVIISDELFK
ncbi:unnamed protein product, partial [Rotaria magnacalcarata]